MWQTLETKAKFIAQVMTGDMTIRRVEDLESPALTYAEVKAIASGNPLIIEKAQVDAELMRLTRLRSAHVEEQYRIRTNLRHARQDGEAHSERLVNLRKRHRGALGHFGRQVLHRTGRPNPRQSRRCRGSDSPSRRKAPQPLR